MAGEEKSGKSSEVKDYGLGDRQWNHDTEAEIDAKILEDLEKEETGEKKDNDDDDFFGDDELREAAEKKEQNKDEGEEEEEKEADEEEDDDIEAEDPESDEDESSSDEEDQGTDEDGDDDKDESSDEDAEEKEVDEAELISNRAKKLAEKYNIDEDSAKKIAEGDLNLAKTYNNDPLEAAHAVRSIQSEYTKVKQALLERERSELNPYTFQDDKVVVMERQSGKKREWSKEDFVSEYRKANQEDNELQDMSDDEVYREAKRKNAEWLKAEHTRMLGTIKNTASERRKQIVEKIKVGNNAQFADEVAAILKHFDDSTLASKDFDEELPLTYAKGRRYDDDLKAAQKEAASKAKKNVKIKERRAGSPTNKGQNANKKGSYAGRLTKEDRETAMDMFDGDKISDEEKYKMYYEIKNKK